MHFKCWIVSLPKSTLKTPLRATERVTGESSTQVGWVYSQTPIVPKLMRYTA